MLLINDFPKPAADTCKTLSHMRTVPNGRISDDDWVVFADFLRYGLVIDPAEMVYREVALTPWASGCEVEAWCNDRHQLKTATSPSCSCRS